ncbi:MAG: (2Fe-2S)-binding protein [Melioribacteraceae bacterium]|nr:(2Fe-2S)-binding protein [Melioribacteraceae bacterium]
MKKKDNSNQFSRRSFLKGVGITTAGAAVLRGESLAKQLETAGILQPVNIISPKGTKISLTVNGTSHKLFVEPRTTLAEALRINLGMTGTKIGCDRGACSACTVLLDGQPVNSCMTLALDAVGLPIETIEGLAVDDNLHPIQKSFIEHDAYQCGFCTSGMIMSCKALLEDKTNPSELEIKEAVAGNLCRCGTHIHVVQAVKAVSNS